MVGDGQMVLNIWFLKLKLSLKDPILEFYYARYLILVGILTHIYLIYKAIT